MFIKFLIDNIPDSSENKEYFERYMKLRYMMITRRDYVSAEYVKEFMDLKAKLFDIAMKNFLIKRGEKEV